MHTSIVTLPDVALETILSFLSYDEIAKYRLVSQKFNQIGGNLLTRGFWQIERRHHVLHKKMRVQLPRRESERRSHPLSRHCDILTAVETRLSMLSMTYLKYMESKLCCFIPGKVLDEIVRILMTVENLDHPPRTHELLQELRDISSMAMEHFDETILPHLQQKVEVSDVTHSGGAASKMPSNIVLLKQVLLDEMRSFKKQSIYNKYQFSSMVKSIKSLELKYKSQTKLLRRTYIKAQEQARYLEEQERKIKEQDAAITELRRHVAEWDQKLLDLTTELANAREEVSNIITSTTAAAAVTAAQPKCLTNIKPRTSLKYYELPSMADFERKRKSPFSYMSETPTKLSRNLDSIISKNITSNISNKISNNFATKAKDCTGNLPNSVFSGFLSNSFEKLMKSPLISLQSRKRKISGEIDFT